MNVRLVSVLSGIPDSKSVKHYAGPPPELTGGVDTRQRMGPPAVLVIEPDGSPAKGTGISLYRFDANGGCVGDTWHMSIDDAKHQANYEYGGLVQHWQEVPREVKDAAAYGLARLREAKSP